MGVKSDEKLINHFVKDQNSHKTAFYNNLIYTILISNMEYKEAQEKEARMEEEKAREVKEHNKIQKVFRSSGRWPMLTEKQNFSGRFGTPRKRY